VDHPAEKIEAYRKLLHGEMPIATRCAIEWLMVEAARDLMALPADRTPWNGYELPSVLSIANDAVAQASRLMDTQFVNIQLYLEPQDTLLLLAYRNLPGDFVDRFAAFRPDHCTSCSRVVDSGHRVVIEDVEEDEPFARHVPIARSAGLRSVQSTPLQDDSGAVIGVMTTYFPEPRSFANDDFDRFDALARDVSRELARACG